MKPQHDITSHVKQHRLAAGGMTQQELADRVGVTRQTIHAIEKGQYAPSVGLALKLAAMFGVRVEDLFSLDEEERDG
ncbi:MAG TPA: helix-turn-helix transcriptional regulator [Candidatus Krumholzibacteria bacterium]|nr:helix-turn-helix transcriptional regulator [Candidatus Krumholzibacteria bacterium]